jgi:hypothetical protein
MIVYNETQNVLMNSNSLLEIFLRKRTSLLRRCFWLVCLTRACVQLREKFICLDWYRRSRTVSTAHIVCNVFSEAYGFDGRTSEVGSTDEVAAKVEEDLCWPRALSISCVPESGKQPLYVALVLQF